jgi:hypothetical protein
VDVFAPRPERYFGVVKIGRLAMRNSCAVGCFFFGFLASRFFASLFPMDLFSHGGAALARVKSWQSSHYVRVDV